MLDMGFIPDVTRILSSCHQNRQSLLFLSHLLGRNQRSLPTRCSRLRFWSRVARRNRYPIPSPIASTRYPTSASAASSKLLKSGTLPRPSFSFAPNGMRLTRAGTPEGGLHADAIHGDKSQLDRLKALDASRPAPPMFLWRPMSPPAVWISMTHFYVINYELPHTPEDYVRRAYRPVRQARQYFRRSAPTKSSISSRSKNPIKRPIASGSTRVPSWSQAAQLGTPARNGGQSSRTGSRKQR